VVGAEISCWRPTLCRVRIPGRLREPRYPETQKPQRDQYLFCISVAPAPQDKISESAEVAVSKSDSKSGAYEFRTKSTQSGGLETDGHRERGSGLSRRVAVRRFVPEARSYWASMRAQSQQRKLVSAGLAERVGFEITVRFSPRGVCEHIGTA
jgi:hypothetical protein